MTPEWTKGPWEVDVRAKTRVRDYADTTIASAGMASRVLEEAQANAHLISAAPELYEALKAAVLILENHPGVSVDTQGMNWALAKAEGQDI